MNLFTIKDLESLSGIKAHTIRIWEQRYHFLKPQRTDTNIRYYSNSELKTVLNISLLNRYGYKISHIDKMSVSEIKGKIIALTHTDAQEDRVINELIQFVVDLKVDEFESLLDEYIASKGIEKTITNIIFIFLEKIGLLWQANHINPAQERLVSNVIRQKIILGIENCSPVSTTSKTALLFLPEGEYHEISLLFMHYLLKKRGIYVFYLGANIPLKDVAYIAKLKQPNILYTHLTALASNANVDKFILKLSAKLADEKVIVAGQLLQGYKKELPANIHYKRSMEEVLAYLQKV